MSTVSHIRVLHNVIAVVVAHYWLNLANKQVAISGDNNAKAKGKEMVKLIDDPNFWDVLAVYVAI